MNDLLDEAGLLRSGVLERRFGKPNRHRSRTVSDPSPSAIRLASLIVCNWKLFQEQPYPIDAVARVVDLYTQREGLELRRDMIPRTDAVGGGSRHRKSGPGVDDRTTSTEETEVSEA